jgi:hypothetical protein
MGNSRFKSKSFKWNQPHLVKYFLFFYAQGKPAFTITKSAAFFDKTSLFYFENFSRIMAHFSTIFSTLIFPSWCASNIATTACCTNGPPGAFK